MVFIGGWRTRRPGYGPYGRPGYGPYYRQPGYGGGNSCLRDLCLLETGCCLAEMVGCGPQLTLLGPSLVRRSFWASRHQVAGPCGSDSRWVRFGVAAIRLYQAEISAKRTRGCCRYSPSCSEFAREALEQHGFARGVRLAVRRLLRCRPGTRGGFDPVPPARG